MFSLPRRGDITLGAKHRFQCQAGIGGGQMGDLPANGLERQMLGLAEPQAIGGAADDRHGGAGDGLAGIITGLPLARFAFQGRYRATRQHMDIGMLEQRLAEGRRAGPASTREEQAGPLQLEARQGAGLIRINAVQEALRVTLLAELPVARGLLLIATELQHATGRPGALTLDQNLVQQSQAVGVAGLPEASVAGRSWRSMTVTCQPRRARAKAVLQPARPAPITRALRGRLSFPGR